VEQTAIASQDSLDQPIQDRIKNAMAALAVTLQQMAEAIANGKSSVNLGDLDRAVVALNAQLQILRTHLKHQNTPIQSEASQGLISLEKIAAITTRLANQVHTDVELIIALRRGRGSRAALSIRSQLTASPTADSPFSLLAVLEMRLRVFTMRSLGYGNPYCCIMGSFLSRDHLCGCHSHTA
jgi:hypothetical protein